MQSSLGRLRLSASVDEINLLFALIGGPHSGTTVCDGTDPERHQGALGTGLQGGVGLQRSINLVVGDIGIAVRVTAENGS